MKKEEEDMSEGGLKMYVMLSVCIYVDVDNILNLFLCRIWESGGH